MDLFLPAMAVPLRIGRKTAFPQKNLRGIREAGVSLLMMGTARESEQSGDSINAFQSLIESIRREAIEEAEHVADASEGGSVRGEALSETANDVVNFMMIPGVIESVALFVVIFFIVTFT